MTNDLTDEQLPGYCLIHCETDVAQFHKRHIARLCRLAGMHEEADAVEHGNEWLFLGPNVIRPIVAKIYETETPMKPETPALPLTEADALRIIERERWAVAPQCGGGWVIDGAEDGQDDADVIELARTRGSLLDAVTQAVRNDETGNILARK